jgi:hypothetical protein
MLAGNPDNVVEVEPFPKGASSWLIGVWYSE